MTMPKVKQGDGQTRAAFGDKMLMLIGLPPTYKEGDRLYMAMDELCHYSDRGDSYVLAHVAYGPVGIFPDTATDEELSLYRWVEYRFGMPIAKNEIE